MPLPTILALFTGSLLLWLAVRRLWPEQRWAGWLALVPVVASGLFVWPFTNNLMADWLERPAALSAACSGRPPDQVVILPAGVHRGRDPQYLWSSATPNSTMRIGDGLHLAAGLDQATVVFPGSESEVQMFDRMRARIAGLEGLRFITDPEGTDTFLAAQRTRALLGDGGRIWLVTSGMHMPRARMTFEAQGFEVCPWPVGPWAEPAPRPWWIFPNGRTISRADYLLHELVGIAWYWVTGRL